MYKCMVTNRNSRLGEKMNRIVVETRQKTYTQKIWEDGELVEIEIGRGFEIVKEISATDAGLNLWRSWSDDEKAAFLSQKLGLRSPHTYLMGQ